MSTKDKTQQADGGMKTPSSPAEGYKVIQTNVLGTIQWFNVKEGYGFIQRRDTEEDIFLHYSAIKCKNPRKYLSSVGEGGLFQFDIVEGKKGRQADNVTIAVQDNPTTTKTVSDVQLDEVFQLKQEQVRLMEELQELKSHFTKETEDMKEKYEEDLRATEATYLKQLEAQKVQSAKEQKEQEERFRNQLEDQEAQSAKVQKEQEESFRNQLEVQEAQSAKVQKEQEESFRNQLEVQEASWKKQQESERRNSWIFIFGGVCVAAGFLAAKCFDTGSKQI